jgi:hypothetical protein
MILYRSRRGCRTCSRCWRDNRHRPGPVALVSDNGACFRGETYQAAFTGDARCCTTGVDSGHVNLPVDGHGISLLADG